MISANAIRRLHCSEPPDEILSVEAIHTALDRGKKRAGIARNAAVLGRTVCFVPPKTVGKTNLKVNCPSLKSNN